MIERHGISGQPGYFFDMASNGYLAISLLPESDEFRHNVQVVLDTVNTMIAGIVPCAAINANGGTATPIRIDRI